MVAILVLVTFLIFVLVDFYFQRRRPVVVEAPSVRLEELSVPVSIVNGFRMPAHLSYHPGHTWAMKEVRHVVRAGLDEFAARLVGPVERVELPQRGRWLRQGEKAWALVRGEHRFEMLSPIEGEVVDLNPEIEKRPDLLLQDPYGVGWLVAVESPAADANLKNLIHGRLANRWMEEAVMNLQAETSSATGLHLQDGGHAVADILTQVPEERWDTLVRKLFLS
jgi:glycine cleavage system H lipoate-binding protein